MVIFCHGKAIGYQDVLNALELGQAGKQVENGQNSQDPTLKEAIQEFEKTYLQQSLQKHNWNISETARMLGIDRSNMFRKMRK